jgi:hypothetical protein
MTGTKVVFIAVPGSLIENMKLFNRSFQQSGYIHSVILVSRPQNHNSLSAHLANANPYLSIVEPTI